MKKTGEMLKKEREKQGKSLKVVAETTRIHIRTLEAMENNEINKLPAKSFLRGFVGSYARYLHLDAKEVLKTFAEEEGTTMPHIVSRDNSATWPLSHTTTGQILSEDTHTTSPDTLPVAEQNHNVAKEKEVSRRGGAERLVQSAEKTGSYTQTLVLIVGAILLFALILLVLSKMSSSTTLSSLNRGSNPEALDMAPPTSEKPLSSENIEDIQSIQNEVISPTRLEPASSQPQSVVEPPSSMASTQSSPTQVMPAQPTQGGGSQRISPELDSSQTTSQTAEVVSAPYTIRVTLLALDQVRVVYRPDGQERVYAVTLNPENTHSIQARKTLNIDLSDGGSVAVTYNGRDLGVVGDLGQPIKLRLPQDVTP